MLNSPIQEYQFDLVNFSDSDATVDLLNSSSIELVDTAPVPIVPTPTPYISLVTSGASGIYAVLQYNSVLNVFYGVSLANSLNTIYIIDGNTYSVIGTFPIGAWRVRGIAFNPNTNTLYVAQYDVSAVNPSMIKIYNCDTLALINNIAVPSSGTANRNGYYQITYDETLNKVLCPFGLPTTNATELANSGIVLIDCDTNTISNTYYTGKGWNQDVCYDPNTNCLNVTFNNNTGVNPCGYYSYSLTTLSIVNIKTFASNVTNYMQSIEYNPNNNKLYIVNEGIGVYVVNPSTYVVDSTITGFPSPRRIYLDLINDVAYVSNQATSLSIISTNTNTITSTLTVASTGGAWVSFGLNNDLFYAQTLGVYKYIVPDLYSNTYYITGTSNGNYNNFVQSIGDNPIIAYKIIMVLEQTQMNNPIQIQYLDADGESKTDFYQPNNYLDTYQNQSNVVVLEFKDGLIFDINYKIVDYIVPANTTVRFVLFYKQYLKSDLLDVIVYDEDKAKYKIEKSLDNNITASKYWGSPKMPEFLDLKPDWLEDMKSRFKKVDVISFEAPELRAGSTTTKGMFDSLLGFSKKIKEKKQIIVSSKTIDENVEPISFSFMGKNPIKKSQSLNDIFKSMIPENFKKDIVFIGVKKGGTNNVNDMYGLYIIKPFNDRFKAIRCSGGTPMKIELSYNWKKDLNDKFEVVKIIKV